MIELTRRVCEVFGIDWRKEQVVGVTFSVGVSEPAKLTVEKLVNVDGAFERIFEGCDVKVRPHQRDAT